MHAPAVVISLFVRVTWGADFGAPSLLQHRVQGQRQALIDASDGHSARHAALAGFEKYASELTTNMLAHNLTMNETEKLAVETIIDFIDSMYEDLNIGHKEDEEEVETCKTQLDLCRNRVNVSEIEGWRSVVETQRNTHNRCRTAEKQFTIHKNQLCQEYEDYRMNQDAAVPPQCLGDYLIRDYVVTTNRDKLDKMEECMTQNRGWLLPMWDKYQKCTDPPPPPPPPTPTPPTPPPPRDCCPAQNEFEDSSCKYALYHDAQCNMFNVCWQQEVTECGAMCARVKISVEARKADNVTAQRIRCLLGVLTESNNTLKPGMLKECKDAAHPTSHWDLPCPNPAIPVPPNPPVPCTRLQRPCEDIWMDAEYKNKPWYGEHVNMCDCQQCARPPPPTLAPSPTTPTPTPPELTGDFMVAIRDDSNVKRCRASTNPNQWWMDCTIVVGGTWWQDAGNDNKSLNKPRGLKVAANGDLVINDEKNKRIQRCPPTGNGPKTVECSTIAEDITCQQGCFTLASNGDPVCGTAGKLMRCPAGGGSCSEMFDFKSELNNGWITAFERTPNDDYLFGDCTNHRVMRCSTTTGKCARVAGGPDMGTSNKGTGDDHLNCPTGLTVAANGDYLISDANNYRVQRCPASGAGPCTTAAGSGKHGQGTNDFINPKKVIEAPNGDIIVPNDVNQLTRCSARLSCVKLCKHCGNGLGGVVMI